MEKKTLLQSNCADWFALRGAEFQPPNAKELLALNEVLPQLKH